MDAFPITSDPVVNSQVWQQAEVCFAHGHYSQAVELYEQMITKHPMEIVLYGRLGLALLLQGEEIDAQSAWMAAILEVDSEEEQVKLIAALLEVLDWEAVRQSKIGNYESAWIIRQHLREFAPDNLDNLLSVLQLSLHTKLFSFEEPILRQITDALRTVGLPKETNLSDRGKQLLQIIQLLLDGLPQHPSLWEFLQVCIPYLANPSIAPVALAFLFQKASEYHERSQYNSAIHLSRACIALAPNDPKWLLKVLHIIQHGNVDCLRESILLAEQCIALSTNLVDRIMATNTLLSSWTYGGGDWQRATEIYQDFKSLLIQLVDTQQSFEKGKDVGFLSGVLHLGGMSFYFEDNPSHVRLIRNQLANISQNHLQSVLHKETNRYKQNIQTRKPSNTRLPKIGYLAGTFRQHSVGWLCRWLLKHHNHEKFDIHLYSSRHSHDFIQQSLIQEYGDRFHPVPSSIADIADRINDDEIDILVELDSLTNSGGCGAVALKPAPIQVHWLGYDSSGIPAVDYFIADPYVLPDNADDYYKEKIWRLPQTYIAVDGFETHLPSLRRDQLNIPADAVVYLSSQTGMKRNVDNVRLQLRILKEVPNSYFLIKSFRSIPEFVADLFCELAEEEGVSFDRLRFLPDVSSEFTHRANLALADIVLDTYPYNGATTTLEALWMGLPIVTRVGEQFAARNSYTMMMNVGVQEGIAWTDEDYLAWGVRLGQDAALREEIYYRLRQSRYTSPLWNGQQFAREMERAYEQMWQQYLVSGSQ